MFVITSVSYLDIYFNFTSLNNGVVKDDNHNRKFWVSQTVMGLEKQLSG